MNDNIFTPKENLAEDDAQLKAKREALKKKLSESKKKSTIENKHAATEDKQYTSPTPPPQDEYSQQNIKDISENRDITDIDSINDIKGWNWGAFFFNWIWGLFNGVYWPLVLFIIPFIPVVGQLGTLIICIFLGAKGNEWAWKAKSWSSVEEFK